MFIHNMVYGPGKYDKLVIYSSEVHVTHYHQGVYVVSNMGGTSHYGFLYILC